MNRQKHDEHASDSGLDATPCSASSGTPETDAWINEQTDNGYSVWSESIKLARRLELERNEWKAKAKSVVKDYLREGREKDQEITRLKIALRDIYELSLEWRKRSKNGGPESLLIAADELYQILPNAKSPDAGEKGKADE